MLRGLTERPNVQSTLILSRRDGSIIRATGVGLPGDGGASAAGKPYQWSQVQDSNGGSNGVEREAASLTEKLEEPADSQQTARPVEILAASIFQFVNNANVLGETLGTTSRNGARADGTFAAGGYGETLDASQKGQGFEDDTENTPGADDVQLLRLRTKHQEIIIFPDPKYICCVVQRVGRPGASHDKR